MTLRDIEKLRVWGSIVAINGEGLPPAVEDCWNYVVEVVLSANRYPSTIVTVR